MASIVDLGVEQRAGVPVVRLAGEIDMSVTASVSEHLDSVAQSSSPGLVLDLTELEYLDSAGLRLLLTLSKQVKAHGQSLRLVVAENSLVASLLEMTRADDIIPVHRTVPEALAALGAAAS